ncbi:type II secretion system protein [Hydrogenimonas sp. SS33]|uniref:type II secretion system protein n=1 Tax=Hydrogenimonas leucolamina TaxID=2954236 RepID=UPI00336C1052
MNRKAFTLIELIFVILLIGVLSAVAVPKFIGMRDNAKITSELSTAASVQTALEACHGEWVINDAPFVCGNGIRSDSADFNATTGYPVTLGSGDDTPLDKILKNGATVHWKKSGENYYGPASDPQNGTSRCIEGKPCIGKCWRYDSAEGTLKLQTSGC